MLGANGGMNVRPEGFPVGLRLEARGYFTFASATNVGIACGASSGCSIGFGSRTLFQLDLLAGITVGIGGRRQEARSSWPRAGIGSVRNLAGVRLGYRLG